MTTYSIRVAINDSETDEDVVADSTPWVEKVGNVEVSGGGGSYLRPSTPFMCKFDLLGVPIQKAALVRKIAVAVQGPTNTTPGGQVTRVGATDECYRIIFQGDVIQARGVLPSGIIQYDAASELSGWLNRKSGTASSTGTGPRALLSAIASAHSVSISGGGGFPNNSTTVNGVIDTGAAFLSQDRPAQEDALNGTWLQTAMAGSGVNVSCDWEGTMSTLPATMWWRPDWFHSDSGTIDYTMRNEIQFQRPDMFAWEDVGIQWGDYYSKITVNGNPNGGSRYYGWARLDSAADRNSLNNKELSISSWIDSSTHCARAARNLLERTGMPKHFRSFRVRFNADRLYQAWYPGTASYDVNKWEMICAMLGDQLNLEDDGSPAWTPPTTQHGLDLDTLIFPTGSAGSSYIDNTYLHTIRGIKRTWDPAGGWDVQFNLEPEFWTGMDTGTNNGGGTY